MLNLRVYGVLINEAQQVLVSDEMIRGGKFTKFPGGGLEPGEGTRDCLKREFMEEMGLKVQVGEHLYTTDHFQQSAFNKDDQILSVYYYVAALEPIRTNISTEPFTFDELQMEVYNATQETESFRFIPITEFSESDMTLPIDKQVAGMISKQVTDKAPFFGKNVVLENDRARLEPLNGSHFDALLPISKKKEIWEFTNASVKNEADFRRYFDTAVEERNAGTAYPFAVYDKLNNRYAGSTRYGNISWPNKRMEIGWTWYHPDLQRTGLNKSCKHLLLSYGFDELDLNRIELKTSGKNLKSQGAMLKIGAIKEGVLRRHMISESNELRDTVYFSFIKEEWPEIQKRIFPEFL